MKRHLHLPNRPRHFKALLVAVGFAAFLLGSCVSSHPVDERPALLWAARSVAVDSLRDTTSVLLKTTNTNRIGSFPKPGLFRRLFPSKQQVADNQAQFGRQPVPNHAQPVPRKCKGCTFNYVQGNQTNSVAGKKATAATGENSKVATAAKNATLATDSAAAISTGGGAAAVGAGASASGGADKPAGIGATIAKAITGPLGYVLAAAAAGAILYLLYLIWGFLPRRNKDEPNQA